jgi:hypothetical protein
MYIDDKGIEVFVSTGFYAAVNEYCALAESNNLDFSSNSFSNW